MLPNNVHGQARPRVHIPVLTDQVRPLVSIIRISMSKLIIGQKIIPRRGLPLRAPFEPLTSLFHNRVASNRQTGVIWISCHTLLPIPSSPVQTPAHDEPPLPGSSPAHWPEARGFPTAPSSSACGTPAPRT